MLDKHPTTPPILPKPKPLGAVGLQKRIQELEAKAAEVQSSLQGHQSLFTAAIIALGGHVHDDLVTLAANTTERIKELQNDEVVLLKFMVDLRQVLVGPNEDGRNIDFLLALTRECDNLKARGIFKGNEEVAFSNLLARVRTLGEQINTLLKRLEFETPVMLKMRS